MAALYQFSLNGTEYCRIELPVCASQLRPEDAALLLEYLELIRRQLIRACRVTEDDNPNDFSVQSPEEYYGDQFTPEC